MLRTIPVAARSGIDPIRDKTATQNRIILQTNSRHAPGERAGIGGGPQPHRERRPLGQAAGQWHFISLSRF